MFNVLPDNFKEIIKSQYKKRRLVVWMFACICIEVIFLVCLLPSYVYLASEENNLVAESSSSAGKQSQDNNSKTAQVLQNVNKELVTLSSGLSSVDSNTIISRLLSLKGSSVSFTEITFHPGTATTSSVTVNGVASTRESLLALTKRFEADDIFQNVDLPVSNFAKDKNINFSIKMDAKL